MDENKNINTDDKVFKKPKKKIRAKYNLLLLFAVIIIIAVCVIITNIGNLSGKAVKSIYEIESNSKCQVNRYRDDILVLNYDGAKFLSKTGEDNGYLENLTSDPYIDIDGSYVLLYDRDASDVTLYKDKKKIYTYKCDMAVKKAKVNKNGYVIILSNETGYNCRVTVLDTKGEVCYIWKIGDVYVLDADISPDNKNIALCSISTDSGVIEENIIFANIDREEEVARAKKSGSLPLYIGFAGSGQVVCVSDDRLCGYNTNGDKKWESTYESRQLNLFYVDESGNTILALSGIKNNTIVEMYTKNGTKSGEYSTDSVVKKLDVNERYIALGESNKISVINYSGKLLNKCDITKEYSDMVILDRKNVVLMGNSSVDLLSM